MKNLLVVFSILIVCSWLAPPSNAKSCDEENQLIMYTSRLLKEAFITDWEHRAMQAYYEESPEVAIWAFENLLDILLKQYEMNKGSEDSDILQGDLILTYGRLAIKFKETGNTSQYQYNILKSLELAKERYKQEVQSKEDVLNFIQRVDEIGRKSRKKDSKFQTEVQ